MTHLPPRSLDDRYRRHGADRSRSRAALPSVGRRHHSFTRNFADLGQLSALTAEIHALRTPQLLIAVDHEGGRVQRFAKVLPGCREHGHPGKMLE